MPFIPAITTLATRGHIFAIAGPALCIVRDPDSAARAALPVDDAREGDLYLGELGGEPCFARYLERAAAPPPGSEPAPLRQLFGALTDEEFGVAGRALGLTTWDRDHRFCGRCGAPTVRSTTERARTCTACGTPAYPRLSPAVIMLVERDGRALLARNARTKMPFFSTLAGFVEVGETLEEAVAREVREEAGVEITDIRYFGSQPWPFTSSLMIAFTARWASGEIAGDPTEILEAAWFPPGELPAVPPGLSIARRLIDDFVRRTSG